MKSALLLSLGLIFAVSLKAQVKVDDNGIETFEMNDGDTTFLMKKYFLVLLKKGNSATELSKEQLAAIQRGHLANIDSLAQIDKLDIAGPMGDDGDLRGILVLRVATLEEAEFLVKQDPAIEAERLSYEIHPWWAAVGSTLR